MMTEHEEAELRDAVSALTVQRDSAHKQQLRTETQNRVLLRHQAELREWLASVIAQWEAAQDNSDDLGAAAHDIHQQGIARLREAESYL